MQRRPFGLSCERVRLADEACVGCGGVFDRSLGRSRCWWRKWPRVLDEGRICLRLRLGPLAFAHRLLLVQENEGALLVADDHIGKRVAIHIARHDLRADAGVVVDEVRNEIHGLPLAHELKPVADRRRIRLRVAMIAMRPKAFADDDVLEPVAVDVREIERVELGEDDAVTVVLRFVAHDEVTAKRDRTALAHLLPPRKPVAVRGEAADHIGQSIGVHVVGVKLCAVAKGCRMLLPRGIARQRCGLLPHAAGFDDVRLAVASHIAHAKAVRELRPVASWRDEMKLPRQRRVVRHLRGVAKVTARVANDVRFPVAIDVRKRRRFVVHLIVNDVPLPRTFLTLRILKPRRLLAGEAIDQNIRPAVRVEIAHKGEEIVRVSVLRPKRPLEAWNGFLFSVGTGASERLLRRIKLMPRLEIRPFIPIRPGDDVHFAIAIEVPEARALAPEMFAELELPKAVQDAVFRTSE